MTRNPYEPIDYIDFANVNSERWTLQFSVQQIDSKPGSPSGWPRKKLLSGQECVVIGLKACRSGNFSFAPSFEWTFDPLSVVMHIPDSRDRSGLTTRDEPIDLDDPTAKELLERAQLRWSGEPS